MNGDTTTDGLSASIVNIARLMRHDGDVSTQSPKTLAPELLELVSVAVLHHSHSHDWFKYLAYRSFPWRRVCGRKSSDFLPVSLSLGFASRHLVGVEIDKGEGTENVSSPHQTKTHS
jgi:hypothetical protein